MKYRILPFLVICGIFSFNGYSQVKIVNVPSSNNSNDDVQINVPTYDSLHNITLPEELFDILDVNHDRLGKKDLERLTKEYLFPFIGQKIYVYPMTDEYRENYRKEYGITISESSTKYRGKYYTIVDIPKIIIEEYEGKYTVRNIYLELVDEKGKKIKTKNAETGLLKTNMYDFHERLGDFLCVGYYEKLKQIMVGNWYMAKNTGPRSRPGNNQPTVTWGHAYQCVDIAVTQNGENYELDLFLQDINGNLILTAATTENLSYLQEESVYKDSIRLVQEQAAEKARQDSIMRESERKYQEEVARNIAINDSIKRVNDSIQVVQRKATILKKYGKYYGNLILQGKIVRGMTKEMCRESWGEPDDINVSIGSWGRHEQWVYGKIYSSYLYFENGKLTAIQD